jgi:hypothetical protein
MAQALSITLLYSRLFLTGPAYHLDMDGAVDDGNDKTLLRISSTKISMVMLTKTF